MKGMMIDGYYIPVTAALVMGFTFMMGIVQVNKNNKAAAAAWGTAFFGTSGLLSGVIMASYGWVPTQGGFFHTILWITTFLTWACMITSVVLFFKDKASSMRPRGAMTLPPRSKQDTQASPGFGPTNH